MSAGRWLGDSRLLIGKVPKISVTTVVSNVDNKATCGFGDTNCGTEDLGQRNLAEVARRIEQWSRALL